MALLSREVYWIKKLKAEFNFTQEERSALTRAVFTGRPQSVAQRAKMSAAKLGKPGPWLGKKRPDLGAKVAAKLSGRPLPESTKAKMRGPRGPQKNPRKKR